MRPSSYVLYILPALYQQIHESGSHPLAVFTFNESRDAAGVYVLADQVASASTGCAYALAGGSGSVLLASKAVEGIAVSALFCHGIEDEAIFFRRDAVVLREPVRLFRKSMRPRVRAMIEKSYEGQKNRKNNPSISPLSPLCFCAHRKLQSD